MDRDHYEDLLRRIERLERGYHKWRRTALMAVGVAVALLAFSARVYSQRQSTADWLVSQQPKQAEEPAKATVEIDASGMRTTYTNFFRVTGNTDEVVLDLGFYSGVTVKNGTEPAKLTDRLVMNFFTAKKLQDVLKTVVVRHEDAFGEIETDPNKRLRPKGKHD
jgi:hypothetical protein